MPARPSKRPSDSTLRGFVPSARLFIGAAHLLEGNYDEAIAAIREAKTIATPEMIGPNQYLMVLARLAEACLGKGNRQRALELSAEAVKRAEGGRRLGSVEAHHARARVLIATSAERDADEIVRLLDRAAEIADRCGGKVYEPAIRESRAALARAIGRPESRARAARGAPPVRRDGRERARRAAQPRARPTGKCRPRRLMKRHPNPMARRVSQTGACKSRIVRRARCGTNAAGFMEARSSADQR